MATEQMEAYAEIVGSKGSDNGPFWYQIYFTDPMPSQWQGPYRDKTDAENAAHEEAKRRNLYLNWRG